MRGEPMRPENPSPENRGGRADDEWEMKVIPPPSKD